MRSAERSGVTVGGYKNKLTVSFFMQMPSTSTSATITLPVTACGLWVCPEPAACELFSIIFAISFSGSNVFHFFCTTAHECGTLRTQKPRHLRYGGVVDRKKNGPVGFGVLLRYDRPSQRNEHQDPAI
jgi:hypothetical protein